MSDLIKVIFYVLFLIVVIIFIVWFLVNYGNTPVGELPTWLWWLMN
jgi:hypothetical protein